jgi:hypothetical protein
MRSALAGGWALSLGLFSGLSAGVPFVWLAWQFEAHRAASPWGRAGFIVAAALAAGMAAAWAWRRCLRIRPVLLRWTGAAWQLVDPANHQSTDLTRLVLCMDLGHALLLQVRTGDPGWPAWLALTRGTAPGAWHGLRVALNQNGAPRHGAIPAAGGLP